MNKKRQRIALLREGFIGRDLDAHYLAYLACFNRQEFYQAHDVLEELWLKDRRGPNGDFYKGLIQLAGAFVHVQKDRLAPARALLRLAQTNLGKYPALHEKLDLAALSSSIEGWSRQLESPQLGASKLIDYIAPRLSLIESASSNR